MGEVHFNLFGVFKRLSSVLFKTYSREFADNLINRLFRLMNQEKLYLESNFSIENLASRLNVSASLLSQIINDKLDQNFFDLVVHFRIQEAKKVLENPKSQLMSMDHLAFEMGYTTLAAFFSDFKKLTNQTPNEYRKQMNLICE
jgi:AraC-like DNA-binding protein